MKNDPVLSSMINFLVPIILIYGLFFLSDFLVSGFFALIYSVVLFFSAFMIFSVRFSSVKPESIVSIEIVSSAATFLSFCYLITILFLITNIFDL